MAGLLCRPQHDPLPQLSDRAAVKSVVDPLHAYLHVIAQRLALLRRPVLHQVPGGIERGLLVQQPHPQGRQCAEPAPRAGIRAALLELREQVAGPVRSPKSLDPRPARKAGTTAAGLPAKPPGVAS